MPLATPAPAPADGTDEALTQAIQWCARNGLIGGFAGEAGGPEEIITREQAAVVLQRYAAMQGADVSAYGDLSGWADGDAVSGWARDAVSWALDNGMLGARDDGTLAPQEEAVCADLTGMIFRMQQTY